MTNRTCTAPISVFDLALALLCMLVFVAMILVVWTVTMPLWALTLVLLAGLFVILGIIAARS
jgi:hypothetical protein